MSTLPAMMSAEVPALTSDEIVNFLISDEIAISPAEQSRGEQKNSEVALDPLEQGLATDQVQAGSILEDLEKVQAGSIL